MKLLLILAVYVIRYIHIISGAPCQPNERWSIETGDKIIHCHCSESGNLDCDWSVKPAAKPGCYDRSTKRTRKHNSKWTTIKNERTLDCNCSKSVTTCSGENRCHVDGVSYQKGDTWNANDITGVRLNCQCYGSERVACTGSVTREVPNPVADAQWVEDHIVYRKKILRPRISTLQACDTGTKVVSSGYTWNETHNEDGQTLIKRCECRDALIQCDSYFVSRISEPHCLNNTGGVKLVGQVWIIIHPHHKNIKTKCRCISNGVKSCKDIGHCVEPKPPINGALVCVTIGAEGPKQKQYCKPLCRPGFDFLNRNRHRRLFEVCSEVTYHRWSGGYADDSLMIAKCIETSTREIDRESYLGNCKGLTKENKLSIQNTFLKELRKRSLCLIGNCRPQSVKCGPIRNNLG